MTIPKFRAVIVVFLVGFALGLSVFVASRMFVRSVLNGDAIAAAEGVAAELAAGEPVESATGVLSSVVRYTYFDLNGNVIASASPGGAGAQPMLGNVDPSRLSAVSLAGPTVIDDAPLVAGLLGLAEAAVKRVAVPVVSGGETRGTLFVEVDQTRSLETLTRAFSVIGMVTVGLAVLAVIAVAFVVTRGTGFGGRQRKTFDPSTLPRDPLTDVPTRSGLTAALEDAVERAAEADQQVGLMIVGLDGFRAVNDIWGHAAGDDGAADGGRAAARIRRRTCRRRARRRRRVRGHRRGRDPDAPDRGSDPRSAERALRDRGKRDDTRREHRRRALPDQRRQRTVPLPRRRQRALEGEGERAEIRSPSSTPR